MCYIYGELKFNLGAKLENNKDNNINSKKKLFYLQDNFIPYCKVIYKLFKFITHIKMSYQYILTIIITSLVYSKFIITNL